MDPQTNPKVEPPKNPLQPQADAQKTPSASVERPPQTAEVPSQYQRPVAPWPPASSVAEPEPAANPVTQESAPSISPATTSPVDQPNSLSDLSGPTVDQQVMGREVTDAAQMQQAIDSASITSAPGLNTTPMLDGSAAPTMSDTQASTLFQEEASTKKLLSHNKRINILKKAGLAIGLLLVILIGYVFFYGNRVAQSYKAGSSLTTYKDAFAEISSSLEATPVDSSRLESGLNKLKIAEDNQLKLGSVFLGNYNPNYKKAKLIFSSTSEYKKTTKSYQEKYSFNKFLTGLSNIGISIENLGKLNDENYVTVTYEQLAVKVTTVAEECSSSIKEVKEAAKPADLSLATESFAKALSEICSSVPPIYQTIITGKTGLISNEDQEKIKQSLVGINNSVTSIVNGSGISSFYINQLTSYSRAAEEESKNLLKSAENILNT